MHDAGTDKARAKRVWWIAAFAAACLVSGFLAFGHGPPPVVYREIVVTSALGNPMRAVVVLPGEQPPPRSAPAVIAIPPYSIPPEAMEIICVELATRGAVCAIPDFFGKNPGESRQRMGSDSLAVMTADMRAIVDFLRRQPFINPDLIGSCGHSVGGTVSLLLGLADPRVRATVPIGMIGEYTQTTPQNLLFLSGLYDEIHRPRPLLNNLSDNGTTSEPKNRELYGSFLSGSARQVTILPTTDHFIETFDPFLIRELLSWYAQSFNRPALAQGPLLEWRRRAAVFLFALSVTLLYAALIGAAAEPMAVRYAARAPGWLIMRLSTIALPLAATAVWALGNSRAEWRLAAIYLLVALPLAQESVSHRVRAVVRLNSAPPFRRLRIALFILLALGAGTLASFGLVCSPSFRYVEGAARWYPVFCLNMALLFPLEVWGRSMRMFFTEMVGGISPGVLWFAFAAAAMLAPGLIFRAFDRVATEIVISVRARLKPYHHVEAAAASVQPARRGAVLQAAILIVLLAVLFFLGYRRVMEGMLTWETGKFALLSILQFAVLPFVITALVVRTQAFRKISGLD